MGRRDKPVRNRRIFAARQEILKAGEDTMKAAGIVRRTIRIRVSDFCFFLLDLAKRRGWR